MKAFVLSGGSVKGSYQAGAIRAVLAAGYQPDIVTGISVGALNAAYLAVGQPRKDKDGKVVGDWPTAGHWLADFWLHEVTGPEVFFKRRPVWELALRVLFKAWDGATDTAPLYRIAHRALSSGLIFPTSGIAVRVGAVSLTSGTQQWVGPESPDFLDAVLASTAEPVTMPLRMLRGEPCCDGGVRDIAPLSQAIHLGASEIIAIVCQPEALPAWSGPVGDVWQVVQREVSIVEAETLANDLRHCAAVNQLVRAGLAPDKREVTVTVIRPASPLPIDARSFTGADVARMVEQGHRDALAVWPPRVVASEGPGMVPPKAA